MTSALHDNYKIKIQKVKRGDKLTFRDRDEGRSHLIVLVRFGAWSFILLLLSWTVLCIRHGETTCCPPRALIDILLRAAASLLPPLTAA